jgi:hypothetical protein
MSIYIDFRMHDQKIIKFGKHLVINDNKRALAIMHMIIHCWRLVHSR